MKIKNSTFYILAFTLVYLLGCEKDFTSLIDVQNNSYQVIRVNVKDSLQYPVDTSAVFRIEFNPSSDIKNVLCDVYSPDKSKLNSTPLAMLDNGNSANGDITANDKIYSASFSLDSNQINGNYEVRYFVTDRLDKTNQVASSVFNYNNGTANVAPVISNSIIDPDTAVVTSTTVILTSVQVFDQNGLSDIEKVYFVVYRPDGTTNGNQNILFDDGDLANHGDQTAGDGIYSLLIQITSANAKGTYRFQFQARDRGGKLSNIINHFVLIQ